MSAKSPFNFWRWDYKAECSYSSTGGLPHSPGWKPKEAPAGMGALRPGIFRLGYAGGGP